MMEAALLLFSLLALCSFNALAAVGLEELVDGLFVVAVHKDVVVAQRILQEVIYWGVEAHTYLGAAHVEVVGVFCQGAGGQVVFVEAFAAAFDEGDVAQREQTLDGDAARCLEVVADDVAFGLLQSDGAVGQYEFVVAALEGGGVGHEAFFPGDGFHGQQGEDRLEVAFASGHDAVVIEQGEGEASGGIEFVDELEAAQREGIEPLFFGHLFEGTVEFHRFEDVFGSAFPAGKGLGGHGCTGGTYLLVGDVLVFLVDALQREVDVVDAPAALGEQVVHTAGHQPRGRGADDTDALAVEGALGTEVVAQDVDALDDGREFAVEHFALETSHTEPGRYLEGGCQRILLSVGQQNGRTGQAFKLLDDEFLNASGGYEYNFEVLRAEGVYVLVINYLHGVVFLKFTQNGFVGGAKGNLLMKNRSKGN